MQIFYRMTDIASTNPSPWSQEDKLHLNKVCLKSFVDGYKDIKPEMYFLMDYCDKKKYSKMVDDIVPFNYKVEYTELGINETMCRAYELACNSDDYVLFQECDYLYQPKVGKLMLEAIQELELVSPYDHRNFYIDRTIHSNACQVELVGEYHFRTTERNTMTWGCHSSLVKENRDMLMKYGYLDDEVWRDFLIAGHQLWIPIPSFATHCVVDMLAPSVDWEAIWKKYQ